MANPQIENGFIQIATGQEDNDILMALIRAKLSGLEYQLVLLIIRKTWGFKKTEDSISLSQLSRYTDKSRRQVIESVKNLVKKSILVKKTSLYKMAIYSFNKDFTIWKKVVKKTALVKKTTRTSEENRRLGSEENQHSTKETLTKETIQKKEISKEIEQAQEESEKDLIVLGDSPEKERKVPQKERKEYGSPEINKMLEALKGKIGIQAFVDSSIERNMAKHCVVLIAKIGRDEFVRRLDIMLSDSFQAKNCNKIKYVYNNIKGFIEPKNNIDKYKI